MRLNRLGTFTACCLIAAGCMDSSPEGQPDTFVYIASIHAQTVSATKADGSSSRFVFQNRLVQDLYQQPMIHFNGLLRIIGDPRKDVDVKVFWIKLSQCVSLQQYSLLLDAIDHSELDPDEKDQLISTVVWPGSEWGTRLVDERDSEYVRDFLAAIESGFSEFSGVRIALETINSGRAASFLQAHRGIDGDYPRLKCQSGNLLRDGHNE